jgi:hypothetical protein
MKRIVLLLMAVTLLNTSCEKNPLWVGEKEFFTVKYKNQYGTPNVSSKPWSNSPFISVNQITTRNNGNGVVQIIAEGIRIQSESKNYEIDTVTIFEKRGNKYIIQDEFNNLKTSKRTDIAAVLVLDMSTSLGDLVSKLKEYAKSFVEKVVLSTPNSKVAVVFFSGKNDIQETRFFGSGDYGLLNTLIDNYSNYQSRTALFEATNRGLTLLNNLNFNGSKALVVFTDGGDNDSNNPEKLEKTIQESAHLRISIGLKGKDLNKDNIESIADSKSNAIIANKSEQLENIFETVAKQVVSVYSIVYNRSDQITSEEIEIKFEIEVDKIK